MIHIDIIPIICNSSRVCKNTLSSIIHKRVSAITTLNISRTKRNTRAILTNNRYFVEGGGHTPTTAATRTLLTQLTIPRTTRYSGFKSDTNLEKEAKTFEKDTNNNNTIDNIKNNRDIYESSIKDKTNKLLSPVLSTLQTSKEQVLTQIKQVREKPWFEHVRGLQNAVKTKDKQEALSAASKALNEFTGYSDVEKLKEKVIRQENEFLKTRQRLSLAKRAYEDAIAARSATQHEINDLLQRKHQWTHEDVTRFTALYRTEHLNEQTEAAAQEEYIECEKQVEKEYTELTKSIMLRYHEEQIWSDKIRSASTYGTIGLMALNVVLFICVQTVFEPMKRQKLADKFEDLLLTKFNNSNVPIIGLVKGQEDMIKEIAELQKLLLLEIENKNIIIKNNDAIPLDDVTFWAGAIVGAIGGVVLALMLVNR
ncbi:13221_t:CDS:2 [Ambispora gerdemannii]|uniref:Sensitive to high expression protein 9, mitochondrial n=1 Tax=Ambispora gerdemannii TaxID=144530 RepID=A0A9N9EYR9_9GLOM|nr:13221_t:CDS:2 [Ambispora gerdemannii]